MAPRTPKAEKKEKKTLPTEMITPEMREAGVDETTPLVTREEMVAELGEEKVAEIEAGAETVDTTDENTVVDMQVETPKSEKKAPKAEKVKESLYYRNILIISEVEDVIHFGRAYKRFTTADKSTLMLSEDEFTNEVTSK